MDKENLSLLENEVNYLRYLYGFQRFLNAKLIRARIEEIYLEDLVKSLYDDVKTITSSSDWILSSYDYNLNPILVTKIEDEVFLNEIKELSSELSAKGQEKFIGYKENMTFILQNITIDNSHMGYICLVYKDIKPSQSTLLFYSNLLELLVEAISHAIYPVYLRKRNQEVRQLVDRIFKVDSLTDALKNISSFLIDRISPEKILIFYVPEDYATEEAIQYQYYKNGALVYDTGDLMDYVVHLELVEYIMKYINEGSTEGLENWLLGDSEGQQVIIQPILGDKIRIGAIAFTVSKGFKLPYSIMNALENVAAKLTSVIYKVYREVRSLTAYFSFMIASRLLNEGDYEVKVFSPTTRPFSVVVFKINFFSDIVNGVLEDHMEINYLLELIYSQVFEQVKGLNGTIEWAGNGYIYALFGPPYFESTKFDNIAHATQVAVESIAYFSYMEEEGIVKKIKEAGYPGLSLTAAISYGDMKIGFWGKYHRLLAIGRPKDEAILLASVGQPSEVLVPAHLKNDILEMEVAELSEEKEVDGVKYHTLII